ncbi:hypothetical protein ZHAS_00007036 [Anopheles sinensis]|uniref:Uncharacterized protein n=1 Tax=Anopheles sinensis TaxID=74873 RepID=A0A084VNP3_ANOSI|nr:hypothetical protein ZHAS_00007036 [Anopheles sinensis]
MAPGRTALSSAFVGVRFASSKAGVTAFNLDDTNSNYSGTPSIRKKSFQIYSGAALLGAQPECAPLGVKRRVDMQIRSPGSEKALNYPGKHTASSAAIVHGVFMSSNFALHLIGPDYGRFEVDLNRTTTARKVIKQQEGVGFFLAGCSSTVEYFKRVHRIIFDSWVGIVPKAPEVNAFAPSLTPFGSNRNLLTFWQQGRRLSPFRHVVHV